MLSHLQILASALTSLGASWLALGGIAVATADLWRHFRAKHPLG